MKKKVLFISLILLSIIFLNLLLIQVINAEPNPVNVPVIGDVNPETGVPKVIEKSQGTIANLTDAEIRDQYLKQEWTKILEKSQIGKIIIKLGDYLSSLNILFIIFIGIGYSLSWLFFLSLLSWITIVIFIYKPVKSFSQLNSFIVLGIVLIVTIFGARFKAIPSVVSFFTPLLSNFWIILLTVIITVIITYLYATFFNTIERVIREKTKKETETRQTQKSKKLEKITDIKIKGA